MFQFLFRRIDSLFQWSKLHRDRAMPGELFLDSLTGQYPPFQFILRTSGQREKRKLSKRIGIFYIGEKFIKSQW